MIKESELEVDKTSNTNEFFKSSPYKIEKCTRSIVLYISYTSIVYKFVVML